MALGYFVSSIVENMQSASVFGSMFTLPMIMFGGFYANGNTYGPWIGWLQYLSPIRYGFEMMVRSQLAHDSALEKKLTGQLGLTLGYWWCFFFLLMLILVFRIIGIIFLKALIKRVN